jgi:hypothetical protein
MWDSSGLPKRLPREQVRLETMPIGNDSLSTSYSYFLLALKKRQLNAAGQQMLSQGICRLWVRPRTTAHLHNTRRRLVQMVGKHLLALE